MLQKLSQYWNRIQSNLFPMLEEEIGPISEKHRHLIAILDMVRIELLVKDCRWCIGRPTKCRNAIARAFVAKAVLNIPTTKFLINLLESDKILRQICGWEFYRIPDESTFSRAFKEFSESQLPHKVHETLIKVAYKDEVVGHVCKDSTAIEAREKPIKKKKKSDAERKKRPRKGELTRIEKQASAKISLEEMIKDLPLPCDVGKKSNAKGHYQTWIGYKLHLSSSDNGIPLAAVLTSASIHDSQVAIPLAQFTSQRCKNFYDLMDSAYDIKGILDHSRSLGHVPIVDKRPSNHQLKVEKELENQRRIALNWKFPEEIRYKNRTVIERVNSRLKDEFGGRSVRVKGNTKVFCHLMFGILALSADQLLKFVT